MSLEAAMKPWICFSVSLICFTSCAVTAPGLNRARARKDENNAPRNAPRVDTACSFRLSDMAWSSISIHPLHPIILTAARRHPHGRRCLRQRYAIIAEAAAIEVPGRASMAHQSGGVIRAPSPRPEHNVWPCRRDRDALRLRKPMPVFLDNVIAGFRQTG